MVPIFQDDHHRGVASSRAILPTASVATDEIDLLERLATQVAIAIQQAQLFNQVQQQVRSSNCSIKSVRH